jgi:hypothetical protein
MGTLLTKDVTIDGGANSAIAGDTKVGKDKVTATGNIGTVTAASALKIANVENIEIAIAAAAATYIDAAGITGAESISFSNNGDGGTVKVTNLAAGTAIGLGIGATGVAVEELGKTAAVTLDLTLADATGAADAITLDYADGTIEANSVTLKLGTGVETLNVKAAKVGAVISTLNLKDAAVNNIVVTEGGAGTLALAEVNKSVTNIDASKATTIVTGTTTATGAVTVNLKSGLVHDVTSGAGNDTFTITGSAGATTYNLDGGAGKNTLNMTLSAADTNFTDVANFETINLTVGGNVAAGFDDAGEDAGLNAAKVVNILGGDSLSTFTVAAIDVKTTATTIDASTFGGTVDLTVAGGVASGLNSFLTIKGGASTNDKVTTSVGTDVGTADKIASMTGIETLVVNVSNDTTTNKLDLSNALGLKTIDTKFAGGASLISLDKVAAGVNIKVTSATSGDNLVVGLASTSGTTDSLNVELTDMANNNSVLNLDVAGIETLNVTNKDAEGVNLDLAGVTATTDSNTTVNISGAGVTTLKSMSSSINTVNASAATGALTIAAADRTSSAMTISGGTGNDSIAMRNAADVLTGGLGTDTLVVNFAAILGGIEVNLGATDQVVSLNGSSNTAVQSGFENVNLSAFTGFGAVVTGSSGANTIVGTALADQITGGNGADIINGGAGNDLIDLTETTAAADVVQYSSGGGTDTVIGFAAGAGADVFSFATALLVNGTPSSTLNQKTLTQFNANNAVGANDRFVEITDSQAAGGVDTAAEVAALLTGTQANIADGDKIIIALDDGADMYLWYWQATATNATAIDAAELTLVAKLVGVTSLADGDLAVF